MIFDTHCHLYDEKYIEGSEEVIKKCIENGISLFMIPGDNIENSIKAIELSKKFKEVYAAVGVHPEEINSIKLSDAINKIKELAKNEKVKAIGEIGLDKHWINDEITIAKQKEYFIAQIELANELHLPVIVHDRDAHGDTLEILKEHTPLYGGVLHCFSGSVEYMNEILKLGLYIGLDGPVTYKNAITPKEIAKYVPIEKLLIETDSPYMPPTPKRGEINYPFYLQYVIEEISRIKSINSREIENITYKNGITLFRI